MITYIIKEPNKEEPFIYRGNKMEFRYVVTARQFFIKINKIYPQLNLKLIREEIPDFYLKKKRKFTKEVSIR